jgi:hypothetical protein
MFANALILLAAAGAALPVVLHLIYRKRAQEIPFSSLKFLKTSMKRTAHRKRLQELLLLAIRVGLILGLVLALAKPILGAARILGGSSHSSVVVVLDDSGSMSCEHNGESRFKRAKTAADKVLRGLAQGDCVSLRLACRPVSKLVGEITADRAAVADAFTKADCTAARGDLAGQVGKAVADLGERSDADLELFVLSDLQRTALSTLPARLGSAVALADAAAGDKAAPRDLTRNRLISVVVVDVSDPDFANAAATDLAVRSRSRAAGEQVTIQAQVRNTSIKTVSPRAVLRVDGQEVDTENLEIEPGATTTASFPCQMATAGAHWGAVELSPDSMAFDNRRFFHTELFRRVPVMVVEPAGAAARPAGQLPGSFYLLAALDPFGAGGEGKGLIEPRLVAPEAAGAAMLSGCGAVILSGLEQVPPALGQALRDYVASGGGLIVFPAASADGAGYEKAFGDRGDGKGRLLPASLGAKLETPQPKPGEEPEGLEVAGWDQNHGVLLPFKGLTRTAAFGGVRVFAGRQLDIPEKSGAQELVTLKGALPWLAVGGFGRGRVYLFGSPADSAASTLPIQKVFLPLLHGMVYDLAEIRERRAEYQVGGTATLAFPEAKGTLAVRVTSPDGKVFEGRTEGADNAFSFGPLDELGVYGYKTAPGDRDGSFVVNPDPEESNLDPMSHAEIEKAFAGFRNVIFCPGADGLDQSVARIREGRDLSGLILGLVLALAVFECFFANWLMPGRAAAEPEKSG